MRPALGALLLLSCVACGSTSKPTELPHDLKSPFAGYTSPQYRDPARWLCLPGRQDPCNRDLSATEIRADGSRAILKQAVAKDPAIDCIYIYPTVDLRFAAANHEDFTDTKEIIAATEAQAALFGQVCALYVPLYRQITIGTYFRSEERREQGLAVAFSDVADAFLHYMGTFNRGRRFVLIGHSQGAEMVRRLLSRFFDDDESMRERLLVAMPIGGTIEVLEGGTKGGSFKNIPLCTKRDERACVVGYRSFREDDRARALWGPPPRGQVGACVNPANIEMPEERAPLLTFFPALHDKLQGIEGVTTPYVFYRDLYGGRCVAGPKGTRVLEVTELTSPGMRTHPVDLSSWRLGTRTGTHILDLQFPAGDLVEMVRRRAL